MACSDWYDPSRAVGYGPWRCEASNSDEWRTADLCPEGYKKYSHYEKSSGHIDYCFGDFINKTSRYRAVCKRSSYPTDENSLIKCCTGENAQSDCHPSYCPTSYNCFTVMNDYCTDRNLFNTRCQAWGKTPLGSSVYYSKMKDFCANNLDDARCKDWCKETHDCDDAVAKWCQEHPDEQFCSCVMSPLYNPQCGSSQDSTCQDYGYQTKNMAKMVESGGCPTYYDCDVGFNTAGDKNVITDTKIVQLCGPDYLEQTVTTEESPQFNILLILVYFIVAICISAGVSLIFLAAKETEYFRSPYINP